MPSARVQIFNNILFILLTAYQCDDLQNTIQSVAHQVGSYPVPEPVTTLPNYHTVNQTALTQLPDDAPSGMIPLNCPSDGNCLFNSASILLSGNCSLSTELRVRTAIALSQLEDNFTNPNNLPVRQLIHEQCVLYSPFGTNPNLIVHEHTIDNAEVQLVFQTELENTLTNGRWSSMWQIIGLATALQMPIFSIYPNYHSRIRQLFQTIVQPLLGTTDTMFVLPIFWTGYTNDRGNFIANHFVPLVPKRYLQNVPSRYVQGTQQSPSTSSISQQHITVQSKPIISSTSKQANVGVPFFISKMSKANTFCGSCEKRIISHVINKSDEYSQMCTFCFKYIHKPCKSPLHIDFMQPGRIPPSLSCLNSTEVKLISQVHPYMNMIYLPSGGQLGLSGQSINIPIPTQKLYNSLPKPLDPNALVKIYSASSKTFFQYVNTTQIKMALQWLKINNRLYKDVDIGMEIVFDHVTEHMSSNIDCDIQEFGLIPDDYQMKLSGTIESCPTFTLPHISDSPLNIFQSHTIEELAFPILYPFGTHGLRHHRDSQPTLSKYFQCRILNKDARWSQCAPYLFWSLHIYEQHALQSAITTVLRTKTNTNRSVRVEDVSGTQNLDRKTDNYMFMRQMRGTAAFWKNELQKLMAKLRTLGAPTFFLSLSANDMHWPDLHCFIDSTLTPEKVASLSYTDMCKIIRENPVMCAIHFHNRWEAFLHHFLLRAPHPLGYVNDYFARVEFQTRGSPHLHIFLWIADSPMLEDHNNPFLIPFIDKYISTQQFHENNPDLQRLVQSLQQHAHTATCARRNNTCRFDFPAPVLQETRLKIQTDTGSPARFYLLKRESTDIWTNPYNSDVLQAWNANMDMQLVGSMYQAARYICTYICKNEPFAFKQKIHSTLQELPKESSQRRILSKIGNILLTHRTISTQETVYRILGLQMVYNSRESIYIDTSLPEKRYRILKSKKQLDELSPGSTDLYVDNMRQYYLYRPNTDLFDPMTVSKFVTNYKLAYRMPNTASRGLPRYQFPVKGKTVIIMERSKPACLQCYIPKLTLDPEAHYFSMLYLFMPFRSDSEIIAPYKSYQEAFQHKKHSLDQEELIKTNNLDKFEKTVDYLMNLQPDQIDDLQCITTPAYQLTKDISSAEDLQKVPDLFSFDILQPMECPARTDPLQDSLQTFKDMSVYTMTDDLFENNLASLNPGQRSVLKTIDAHKLSKSSPLHLFVTGGAGTGKSFLLTVLREHLLRMNNKELPNVVVAAPTGVAAFNIGGLTLHTLLHLPTQHKSNVAFRPLSPRSLKILCQNFSNVSYLIIDEISMVSYNTLEHIHLRLNEICTSLVDCNSIFGGISIIAFGDLYQLRPVFGSAIFSKQSSAGHLWKDNFQMIELTENQRQLKDPTYAQLLNRIRIGEHTDVDIQVLQSRIQSSNHSLQQYLHIFPLKIDRDSHNTKLLKNTSNTDIHIINAIHDAPSSSIPSDDQKCAGIPCQIILAIGARVMLIRNIHTAQGLVNGAQGTVTSFEWTNPQGKLSEQEMPSCVNVLFDDHNIITGIANVRNPIGITPLTVQFLGNDHRYVSRTQIPLTLSFGTTVHKVQGLTLKKAVVDIGPNIFSSGMSYVALSRVSKLEDLYLLKLCTPRIYPSSTTNEEMVRLREFTSLSSSNTQ